MPAWLVTVLRPAALTILVLCVALPLTQILPAILPGLHPALLLVAMGAAALEAHFTHGLIRSRYMSGVAVWRLRAVEFGLYLVAIKLAQIALVGAPAEGWPTAPMALLAYLLDAQTVITFVLMVGGATAVSDALEDLDRVGETPERDKAYVSPLDALTSRFFVGGALVLVLSGLARVGLQDLLNLDHPPVTGLVANVLAYFVVGFLLLGQVRLALLASTWQAQGARVPSELGGRWVRYSLGFLGLAALIAFALPTGYTAGALSWLGGIFIFILSWVWALAAIGAGICLLPVSLLSALLNTGRIVTPPTNPLPLTPPAALLNQPMPAWVEVLRTVLVWALLIGMALYVVSSYLRDRPELARALRDLGALRKLKQLWAALRHRVSGLAAAVQALPVAAWLRERLRERPPLPPLRSFRLGGVTPREQVQYYYLSLLRRASEYGFGRKPGQTPAEYRPTLAANLPENSPEVQALTEAFVETRYSAHPVGPEQVQSVRTAWGRLRAALAKQKKLVRKERGQDG
jgi:hypothetical protein